MPLTSAQTLTALAAQPNSTGNPNKVTVNLKFQGAVFDPDALFAALQTLYGAAKIYSESNQPSRNSYSFTVIP